MPTDIALLTDIQSGQHLIFTGIWRTIYHQKMHLRLGFATALERNEYTFEISGSRLDLKWVGKHPIPTTSTQPPPTSGVMIILFRRILRAIRRTVPNIDCKPIVLREMGEEGELEQLLLPIVGHYKLE